MSSNEPSDTFCKHGTIQGFQCDGCDLEKELEGMKAEYKPDDEGFVRFGNIALGELGQQSQYASRYIDGVIEGYPNLGDGLRFKGDPGNYHEVKIHIEDVQRFVQRYQNHRENEPSYHFFNQ